MFGNISGVNLGGFDIEGSPVRKQRKQKKQSKQKIRCNNYLHLYSHINPLVLLTHLFRLFLLYNNQGICPKNKEGDALD